MIPVVLKYIEEKPASIQGEYVFQISEREWLFNREPDRAFAVDEVVHFRDPEQAVIYLEKYYPDLYGRFVWPDGLEDYLRTGTQADPEIQPRLL